MSVVLKDLTIATVGSLINNTKEKSALVDFDMIPVMDSKDNNLVKKYSFSSLKVAVGDQVLTLMDNYYTKEQAVRRIDLSGQVQTTDYRRSVIALCELTNTDIQLSSFSRGILTFKRSNGLSGVPIITVNVGIEKIYNTTNAQGHILIFGGNGSTSPRLCTFTYNGVKYGGLEFYYGNARHGQVFYEGEGSFDVFGVDYYNTQTSTAINTEINSSLAYDVVREGRLYYNQNLVWHESNDGSGSGMDADLLDGLHASSFMTGAGGEFTGSVTIAGSYMFGIKSTNGAYQRSDGRNDDTNYARIYKYGVNNGGVNDRFREAWYDGASYVNIDVVSGKVRFGGVDVSLSGHTHANLTAGNGISGTTYNGATAYTWSVVGDTGITATATGVAITSITAGDATVGALRYSGNTANSGQMNGSTAINTATTRLNYNGYFYAVGLRYGAGGNSSYSDERLKKYIKNIEKAPELIYGLQPRMYKLRAVLGGINQYHYGLIAQEVVKVLEDAGIEKTAFLQFPRDEDEYFGIDYTQLITPLIATVQELNKRLIALEKGEQIWS